VIRWRLPVPFVLVPTAALDASSCANGEAPITALDWTSAADELASVSADGLLRVEPGAPQRSLARLRVEGP
jgi:hypothetical protein